MSFDYSFQNLSIQEENSLKNLAIGIEGGYYEGYLTNFSKNINNGFKKNAVLNNSLDLTSSGVKQAIDTLTSIRAGVVNQKFYTLGYSEKGQRTIDDYIPIETMSGGSIWNDSVLAWKSFQDGTNFEASEINSGQGQIQTTNYGLTSVTLKVKTWGERSNYNYVQFQQMAQAGSFSYLEELEKARKKNWDLGIQRLAFLGHRTNSEFVGLLNQSDVNSNTTTITKKISTMTYTEYDEFIRKCVADYIRNSNSTEFPDTFVIGLEDWAGMGGFVSPQYPNADSIKIKVLREVFKSVTANANAEVLPVAYCDQNWNNLSKNRYVMYNKNRENLSLMVPLSYTTLTGAQTLDGLEFTTAAIGRYSYVKVYRPKSMLYFDFAN